jgi:hypothetical protein
LLGRLPVIREEASRLILDQQAALTPQPEVALPTTLSNPVSS